MKTARTICVILISISAITVVLSALLLRQIWRDERLIRSLGDSDEGLRHLAVSRLAKRANNSSHLILRALSDDDVQIRAGAVRVIGEIDHPSDLLITELLTVFRNDQIEGVRLEAYGSLLKIGLPVGEGFMESLSSDNPIVRRLAAIGIGRIGFQAARPCLVKLLNDDDDGVRSRVVTALGLLGCRESVKTIEIALADDSPTVRADAAYSLAQLGSNAEEAVPALIQCLEHCDSRELQTAVAFALKEIGSASRPAIPELMKLAFNNGNDTAGEALRDIVEDRDTVRAIAEKLRDEDESVRRRAAWTLVMGLRAEPVIPELIAALDDRSNSVRWGAAVALGEVGSPSVVAEDHLRRLAKSDVDMNVRAAALTALNKIQGK